MNTSAIKYCYWAGAIADAFIGALLLFPQALAPALGLAETPTRLSERLAMDMASALLIGWTALLLWAANDPVERRGVLALTVFPVIAGLGLTVFLGWTGGYVSTAGAATVWIMQGALTLAFGWAFISARRLAGG